MPEVKFHSPKPLLRPAYLTANRPRPAVAANVAASHLSGRARHEAEHPPLSARTTAQAVPEVVIHPVEPLATPLGVWLGNQRNPATRLRLQVGSDGQSLNVLKIDIGIHGSTEFNVKTSFKVKSMQGNILNALAQDFDLESVNANDLLRELADRTDVPQMLRWIGANDDVEVHANVRPPTRQAKKEAALREPFVRALKVQARRVQVEARKHESPDLYMSAQAVHAATIDPQLERVRKDLLGLSLLGE